MKVMFYIDFTFHNMEPQKFKCIKHKQNSIQFFCTANNWHIVPLCHECIPVHTQNHAKNVKVMLEKYETVKEKFEQRKDLAKDVYQKKIKELQNLLLHPIESPELEKLTQCRIKVLDIVNSFFNNLEQDIKQKNKDTQTYQIDLLSKLKKNIQLDLYELEKKKENLEEWTESIKRVYFKDSFQTYVDEIDQIMAENRERITQKKDLIFNDFNKGREKLLGTLSSLIAPYKEKQEDNSKLKKKINKVKKCNTCGSQLQYLTSWKKHLVCPNCGNKQRNYVLKKV